MSANLQQQIEGEQNRIRILQYMVGRQVTNQELRETLNLTKQQVEHHLRTLRISGHVKVQRLDNIRYGYKRTNKKYIPKDFSDKLDKAQKLDMLEEDILEIKPTVPHARVIRLLKNPLPPVRKKHSSGSMYGSMQSGMGMFDGL